MLKHRRRTFTRRELAHASPVATAIAREKMRRHMVTFGIEIFLTDDGAPAAELLAHLGWVLAIGAEIAALVTPGTTEAKRLHAALRTVIQISTQGGHWQAALAGVLQQAADQANGLMVPHPMQGVDLIDAADYIASRIRTGTATLADVAGPEIYAAAFISNLASASAQPVAEPFAWIWPSGHIDAGLPCGTSEHDKAVRLQCRALTLAPHITPTADGWNAQASSVAAQEKDIRQFWAVIAPCGEGVLFEHKKDAHWTHTGQGTGSDGFGVPSIGDAFREAYAEEDLELVRVQAIDAARSQEAK